MATSLLPGLCLALLGVASAPDRRISAAEPSSPCQQSPTQDLLPEVVAPMVGVRPVWMVGGSATWGNGEPIKTLWVLLRTSETVRIRGRRLDGPGVVKLRTGDDPPTDTLVIPNRARQSATPGGASPVNKRAYVFLPSHVFYPSPGCWEFTVRIGDEEVRIVRDLNPGALEAR